MYGTVNSEGKLVILNWAQNQKVQNRYKSTAISKGSFLTMKNNSIGPRSVIKPTENKLRSTYSRKGN